MTTKANRPSRKSERAEIAQEIADIMDHGQTFLSEDDFNRATSVADMERNIWKRSLVSLRAGDKENVRLAIWKLTASKLAGAYHIPKEIEELIG